jgi:hypothetical protein
MLVTDQKTLAQRLSEGRLPVAEALRYAMQLADCLGKLHETGKAHGAVSPSNLALVEGGVELLPAPECAGGAITPYTAPEVVQGRPADARSDIFAFGAILFEMITGRRAFEGESRVTLSASLTETPAPASGSPTVDRLVGPCLNKNPEARSQRMQKIILELKLLSAAVRRSEAGAAAATRRDPAAELGAVRAEIQQVVARLEERLRNQETSVVEMQRSAIVAETAAVRAEVQQLETRLEERLRNQETSVVEMQRSVIVAETAVVRTEVQQMEARLEERLRSQETGVVELQRSAIAADTAAVRAEIQQMEERLDARLRSQETGASEMYRSANDGVNSLKLLVAAMQSELAANHQQTMERTGGLDEAATEAIFARVDRGFEVLNARVAGIERTVEEIRRHSTQFENNIAADLVDLEQNIKAQSTSIESARTAMAQTDDLVERVVEALESLQTAMLDQNEAGDRFNFAVN